MPKPNSDTTQDCARTIYSALIPPERKTSNLYWCFLTASLTAGCGFLPHVLENASRCWECIC
jgi:hypothetical protein